LVSILVENGVRLTFFIAIKMRYCGVHGSLIAVQQFLTCVGGFGNLGTDGTFSSVLIVTTARRRQFILIVAP